LATFDLELSDKDGTLIATLEGFTFRRVDIAGVQRVVSAPVPLRSDATMLERLLAAGIRAKDADAAFARVLSADATALIMSSIPLTQLRALYTSPTRKTPKQAAQNSQNDALYANATEARIARMICDVLGVETIKPEDEFLAFGGGSLAGIRLFARVRKEMGVDLALSALFQAPTLRQLAALVIEHGGSAGEETANEAQAPAPTATVTKMARKWSPLVRIAAGKPGRRPLFCMHGAGGNVVNFKPIADRISEGTPFYGLQAQGVDGRNSFQESVEEMAQSYIAAIQTVDPIGPYRLAGYSGGGVVAYEMAQRIVQSGRKVEIVVMFDTLEPAAARTPVSLLQKIKLLPQVSPDFALEWPQRRLAEYLWRRRLRRAESGQSLDAAEPAEMIGARAWDSFVEAQTRYEAQPYDGDLLIFRATNATMPYLQAGPSLGWDKLVSGDIQIVEIEAWHESVFESPSIEVVASALNARLDALDRLALLDEPAVRRTGSV
jgi:thioesterase domain-containing protein/acyl carrier protein